MAGREKPFERQKPTGAAGFTRLIPARDCRILRGRKARKPTVVARREAIRAARRKRQAGNGPSTSQDADGCGPRSARNRGEEPCERETLRRVNPMSGRLERSGLRKPMRNRHGRRTSKAVGPGGISVQNIGVRRRCRGAKAQESRGDSQGSPPPSQVILWRRTQVHERRSRGNSRRLSTRNTSRWRDDQTTPTTKRDRPSDTAIRLKGLCRTGELHERRTSVGNDESQPGTALASRRRGVNPERGRFEEHNEPKTASNHAS